VCELRDEIKGLDQELYKKYINGLVVFEIISLSNGCEFWAMSREPFVIKHPNIFTNSS
jgi:esterase/lipase superfamily enzyme